MTNNPTIDGVSRVSLQQVLEAYDYANSHPNKYLRGTSNWCAAVAHKLNEFQRGLDAPAVERKPKGAILRFREYVGKGQGGRDLWRDWTEWSTGTVEYAKSKLDQTKDLTHIQFEVEWLYSDTPEVAALQSTIARLEARIAELDSGRGEPVAWLAEAVGPDGTAYRRTSSTTSITVRDAKYAWGERVISKYEIKIQPLFTAPPAPVVVVDKYDDVLLPFLAMMRNELHANAGKGDRPGWLSMTPGECLLEIYYHLGKLQKGVKDGNELWITEYSADVANMAMMLADICGILDAAAALNGPAK